MNYFFVAKRKSVFFQWPAIYGEALEIVSFTANTNDNIWERHFSTLTKALCLNFHNVAIFLSYDNIWEHEFKAQFT